MQHRTKSPAFWWLANQIVRSREAITVSPERFKLGVQARAQSALPTKANGKGRAALHREGALLTGGKENRSTGASELWLGHFDFACCSRLS